MKRINLLSSLGSFFIYLCMVSRTKVEKIRYKGLSISTSLLVHRAGKMGLSVEILPENILRIRHGQKEQFFYSTYLPCNNYVAAKLADNKDFTSFLFEEHGIPTPRSLAVTSPEALPKILKSKLRWPLVVKPVTASHGDGATMNIQTKIELGRALRKAFRYLRGSGIGNRAIVQEYFVGKDLRLFVVGNKVISSLWREQAYVIGDGEHSIKQLILTFNKYWAPTRGRRFDLPFCPMPFDRELSRCLATQHLSLRSVPEKNKKIYVRWNGNISTGGRGHDITHKVHPAIQRMAVRATKVLGLSVAGVDILCKDITSGDITKNNITVLEVNDAPGFDVHVFPQTGRAQDVTGAVLQHAFGIKEKGKSKNSRTE